MKTVSIILIGCSLIFAVFCAGCTGSSTTVSEPSINSVITIKPGDQQTFQAPWMGTYTHISIESDIPIKIIWNNQQENTIQSNNFSLDKKFYSNQTITRLNTNPRPATVKVEIAAVKEYKSLV